MQADEIRLTFTCGEDWAGMTPRNAEGSVRHCSKCDRDVTDLSAMTEAEARACLAGVDAEGRRPCVRYAATNGQVLFGIREPARRRLLVATAAVALAVPAAAAVVDRATHFAGEPAPPAPVAPGLFDAPASTGSAPPAPPRMHVSMGTFAPPPPPATSEPAPNPSRPR